MHKLPTGVCPSGRGIQIRWCHAQKQYSETLLLEPNPENYEYASKVRDKKIAQTKNGTYVKGRNLVILGNGTAVDLAEAYTRMFLAARKRKDYRLSKADESFLIKNSKNKCAVTGVQFDIDRGDYSRSPFSPSLDRINSKDGYSLANCRIVCIAANLAMNEWGEWVLARLAKHYVSKHLLNECSKKTAVYVAKNGNFEEKSIT